jgi:putative endonuclease
MTNFLFRRVMQHKLGEQDGFTKRYNINRLVYFETFRYVNNCIACEKQIKSWSRAKKVILISSLNPTWEDLAANWSTEVEPLLPEADSSLRSE